MGVKNKTRKRVGTAEIPGNGSNNTTCWPIARACDMVVKLKGTGVMYMRIENGQSSCKLFDIEFLCQLQAEVHFRLDNDRLQVSTSFRCYQDIVIDPEEAVRLKLQITKGKLRSLITEDGRTIHKQCTEIAELHVSHESACVGGETTKDEDADVNETDLEFVEVTAPKEDVDATANARGTSIAAAKRSLETAPIKKYDDVGDIDDESDGEGYADISSPE